MSVQPLFFLLGFHFILMIILLVLVINGKPILRKENIIPLILLPIFGPLAALIVEWMNNICVQGEKFDEILLQPLGDDILWKTVKSYQESGNLVPLEEALLINENDTKRRMILNALYDDPLKYLDVLVLASHNKDAETAHYATTTLSHSQRSFEVEIQRAGAAVEEDPDNLRLLDFYINLIEKYIDSGLLEEYLLNIQRIVYSTALDKKLALVQNDKTILIKKLRNNIELKEYGAAYKLSDQLKNLLPEDEEVWNEVLRVCVEGNDKEKLQETIEEIQKTPIVWTKQGKEKINLWIAGAR